MQTVSSTLPQLNSSNYPGWKKLFAASLAVKGWSRHINHPSFDDYWNKEYTKSERLIQYERDLFKIYHLKLAIEKELEAIALLEKRFNSELPNWAESKAKEQRKWKEEEEKLIGTFISSIDSAIWTNVKSKKSAFAIWNALSAETNQKQAGNFCLCLVNILI